MRAAIFSAILTFALFLTPAVAAVCRARAAEFSWHRAAEQHAAVFQAVARQS